MLDEAGSLDCRVVIDAKRSLEDVLRLLSDLPHTDHIRRQVLAVHNQLEGCMISSAQRGQKCHFGQRIGVLQLVKGQLGCLRALWVKQF